MLNAFGPATSTPGNAKVPPRPDLGSKAVMISFLGGLMGIGFGVGLARIISMQAGYATVVTGSSIGVAFGVSVLIGLLFGIYPAVQAAKLDPIEAIRYE